MDLPHLQDEMVPDVGHEFSENGFFNSDLDETMSYGWKAWLTFLYMDGLGIFVQDFKIAAGYVVDFLIMEFVVGRYEAFVFL